MHQILASALVLLTVVSVLTFMIGGRRAFESPRRRRYRRRYEHERMSLPLLGVFVAVVIAMLLSFGPF